MAVNQGERTHTQVIRGWLHCPSPTKQPARVAASAVHCPSATPLQLHKASYSRPPIMPVQMDVLQQCTLPRLAWDECNLMRII